MTKIASSGPRPALPSGHQGKPRAPLPGNAWPRLRQRLGLQWRLKLGLLLGFAAAFFPAYLLILKHPVLPVAVMPLTAVDRAVGFAPGALLLYVSLWLYVPLAPGLLAERRQIVLHYRVMAGLALVGLGIFLFRPTAVPPPEVDWTAWPAFAFLKSADGTGNACPSLHAAFAVFSACWIQRLARGLGARGGISLLNAAWCGGILYSTLATKQHVALDVLAGAGLGAAAVLVHFRMARRATAS